MLGALIVGIVVPAHTGRAWLDVAAAVGGMLALAVVGGVIESAMARLRLTRVPQLLVGAATLSAVGTSSSRLPRKWR